MDLLTRISYRLDLLDELRRFTIGLGYVFSGPVPDFMWLADSIPKPILVIGFQIPIQMSQFQNVSVCSRSRKAKILTAEPVSKRSSLFKVK